MVQSCTSAIPRVTSHESPLTLKSEPDNPNFSFEILLSHSAMADDELIAQALLRELSQTPYACSGLAKLNGGTANFIYRGTLLQPLDPQDAAPDSTTETVVIKHSEGFSPGNRDFLLDLTRCVMTDPMTPRHIKMCSDLS